MTSEDLQDRWATVKFQDVVESLQPGFACGKRDENGYVQLRMNNIGLEGRLVTDSLLKVPKSETDFKKYKLQKGDVIFNNTNSAELVGKTILFNDEVENCVYSNHLTRIRVKKEVTLPEFIMNYLRLQQRRGAFELLCRRFVGQAAVPRESLLNLDLPLPPLKEQKAIVAKIEELFSESRSARKALDKVPEIMKKLRQSVLTSAFSGKLIPLEYVGDEVELQKQIIDNKRKVDELRSGGKKTKKTLDESPEHSVELPELAQGWIWTTFSMVCSKVQDGTHFSPKIQYKEPGKNRYLYITAKNIKDDGIDLSDVTYVDENFHNGVYEHSNPERGDVLLTKDGVKTGAVTVNTLSEPFSILSSVAFFKPIRASINERFLMYYLKSPLGFKMITGQMTGTAIKRIILDKLRSSPIPVPTLPIQEKIVAKIDELFALSASIETNLATAKGRAILIEQSILAKAFRSELVTYLNDEPVSIVPERIKKSRENIGVKTSKKK